MRLRRLCSLLLPWTLAGAAEAAGSFQGLGADRYFSSGPTLSRNGTTVVGTGESEFGFETVERWTAGSVWERLLTGYPPSLSPYTMTAVSDDGQVLVGHRYREYQNNAEVVIAPPGRGPLVTHHPFPECGEDGMNDHGTGAILSGLSSDGEIASGSLLCDGNGSIHPKSLAARFLPTGSTILGLLPGDTESSATSISRDGAVVVGWSTGATDKRAFRWTEGTGLVALPLPADGMLVVSGDGSTVTRRFGMPASLWTEEEGIVPIGDLPGGDELTYVYGLSDDGRVVFGWSSSADGGQAFRFTREAGIQRLGHVPGTTSTSGAQLASADGSRIFGTSYVAPGPAEPFVWSESAGMRRVKDVLASFGLPVAGWTLYDVRGVSADGRTFTGNGRSPEGVNQIWIATIPTGIGKLHALSAPDATGEALPAALSGDGRTVLGAGDCAAGGTCVLRWRAGEIGWAASVAPESLGDGSGAALSRDGAFAIGSHPGASGGSQGWRVLDGATTLEPLPLPEDCESTLMAVAWTGAVAVGSNASCAASAAVGGFLWSRDGGLVLGTGVHPASVSADGRIVAGVRDIGLPPASAPSIAFGWSHASGYRDIAIVPPGTHERVRVSADASTIVGVGFSAGQSELFRWTDAGGLQFLGAVSSGSTPTGPRALSIDAAVIAGDRATPSGTEAFVWSESLGLVGLGVLPGHVTSTAEVVSFTGRLVFGRSIAANGASKAFVWDAEGGLRSLEQALWLELGLDVEGWSLESVAGISDDGLTLAGTGVAADGTRRGWLLTLP